MYKYILSLIIFGLSVNMSAQTPGYMGKRLLVSYGLQFSPSFFNKSVVPISEESDIYLNLLEPIEMEYVLNRKMSIVASYTPLYNVIEKTKLVSSYSFPDMYTTEYEESRDNYDFKGELSGNSFGVKLKYYTKNIAPIGRYLSLEIDYLKQKFLPIAQEASNSNYYKIPSYDIFFNDPKGYHTYSAILEFGKQRVYFNRITTNLAVNLGYVFNTKITELAPGTSSNTVYYLLNNRLQGMYAFNIKFAIGLLII